MTRAGWAVIIFFGAIPSYGADTVGKYVGAAACVKCHANTHRLWTQSRHSKMVQPASAEGVKGDFARGRVVLRGKAFLLQERNGGYYITESYLTGKPRVHRVDYTLGNRRIQHYLSTLPDGRVIVLPPSWDIRRKQWLHNLDIDDPEEVPGVQFQLWNKSCYSCHVSQEKKNFNPETETYKTAWLDFGINCERCHGPASRHAAKYSADPVDKQAPDDIVVQTRLDAARSTQVCAQCHSFRDIYVDGFAAGDDYYDHFLPVLDYGLGAQEDPAYWPDGRTRRFSMDAFGLWQSECYLKGQATCLSCHAIPHNTDIDKNPQLAADSNGICTQCHEAIGKDVPAHTHHAVKSAGSSCVECHMPRTVFSIKAEIRDHSMTVPVPENTIRHEIPNACNLCHKNRSAQWALDALNQWGGSAASRQRLIRRADAFSAARAHDASAVPGLVAILSETSEGELVRANAAGYLGGYTGGSSGDPRAYDALYRALSDPTGLVRAVAALSIKAGVSQRQAAVAAMVPMLGDAVSIVRVAAAVALVSLGIRDLPGEDGERFERAKQVYRARAELNSDDAENQVAAGKFYYLAGDAARAAAAFQAGLKLDPASNAEYFLAAAYMEQGKFEEARKILLSIPRADPQYGKAQRLLDTIKIQIAIQAK
jgi:predicted CXXCH cytochrome family protein